MLKIQFWSNYSSKISGWVGTWYLVIDLIKYYNILYTSDNHTTSLDVTMLECNINNQLK